MKKSISFTVIIWIIMLFNFSMNAQTTVPANSPSLATDHLGWDVNSYLTVNSLDIATKDVGANAIPINFYTDNTLFLQVLTGGDLNIAQPTNGYMIDNDFVLRHNGTVSSIYVGVGAGNSTSAATENTFVGNNCGNIIGLGAPILL